jgi:hypothetical protein
VRIGHHPMGCACGTQPGPLAVVRLAEGEVNPLVDHLLRTRSSKCRCPKRVRWGDPGPRAAGNPGNVGLDELFFSKCELRHTSRPLS